MDNEALERWLNPPARDAEGIFSELVEPFEPLSRREMEVLGLMTKGMSNKEIATGLGISHQTVKNHVTSILRKLGVEDPDHDRQQRVRGVTKLLHDRLLFVRG